MEKIRDILERSEMYCSLRYESARGIPAHDDPSTVEAAVMIGVSLAVLVVFFVVLGVVA